MQAEGCIQGYSLVLLDRCVSCGPVPLNLFCLRVPEIYTALGILCLRPVLRQGASSCREQIDIKIRP